MRTILQQARNILFNNREKQSFDGFILFMTPEEQDTDDTVDVLSNRILKLRLWNDNQNNIVAVDKGIVVVPTENQKIEVLEKLVSSLKSKYNENKVAMVPYECRKDLSFINLGPSTYLIDY